MCAHNDSSSSNETNRIFFSIHMNAHTLSHSTQSRAVTETKLRGVDETNKHNWTTTTKTACEIECVKTVNFRLDHFEWEETDDDGEAEEIISKQME